MIISDQHLLAQHVMSKNIQLGMAEPTKLGLLQEFHRMMIVTSTNLAIVLDLDCPQAMTLLSEVTVLNKKIWLRSISVAYNTLMFILKSEF